MGLKEIWLSPGPDGGYSWIVLLTCFFSNLIMLGFIRCQGNIFLSLLQTLDLSREEASYPVTTYMVALHVAGLFTGAANHYFNSRQIILVATCMASVGLFACYFLPQNIVWICLSYGLVAGFSVGFIFPSELQILTSYFNIHRSKAQNALAAGFTCGGLVFPFLMEFILEKFALRGMWLIACGILLQSLVFASLMRPRTPKHFPVLRQKDVRQETLETVTNGDHVVTYRDNHSNNDSEPEIALVTNYKYDDSNGNSDKEAEKEIFLSSGKAVVIVPKNSAALRRQTDEPRVKEESFASLFKKLLITPTFYAVTACYAIDVAAFFAILVVFVDYGLDSGLSEMEATMLIPTLSMGELVARVFSGWITDSMIISPHKQAAIGSLASCVIYLALTVSEGYFLYGIALIIGMSFCVTSGARLFMTTNMFGVKNGATVCGVGNFGIGCATLWIPKLIGLFRDSHGSYFYLFVLISALYVILSIILFTDEFIYKNKNKNRI